MFKFVCGILISFLVMGELAFADSSGNSWNCLVRGSKGFSISFSVYNCEASGITCQIQFTKINGIADNSTALYGPKIVYFPTLGDGNPTYSYSLKRGSTTGLPEDKINSYLPQFVIVKYAPLTIHTWNSLKAYVCNPN